MGLWLCVTTLAFYVDPGDLNFGLHACLRGKCFTDWAPSPHAGFCFFMSSLPSTQPPCTLGSHRVSSLPLDIAVSSICLSLGVYGTFSSGERETVQGPRELIGHRVFLYCLLRNHFECNRIPGQAVYLPFSTKCRMASHPVLQIAEWWCRSRTC